MGCFLGGQPRQPKNDKRRGPSTDTAALLSPEWIRTTDLPFGTRVLYPAELRMFCVEFERYGPIATSFKG